jgi:hypothetical protein
MTKHGILVTAICIAAGTGFGICSPPSQDEGTPKELKSVVAVKLRDAANEAKSDAFDPTWTLWQTGLVQWRIKD